MRPFRLWLFAFLMILAFSLSFLGLVGNPSRVFSPQAWRAAPVHAVEATGTKLEFLPPTEYRGKTVSQVKIPSGQKLIALTFDDGPWGKTTQDVLKILADSKVKATFFWIGSHLQRYPDVGRQVVQAGHAIANHTWSHGYKPVSEEVAKSEIENTSYLIAKTTGVQTRLFRPPGGILDNGLVAYAQKKTYGTVMWNVDPQDTAAKISADQITQRVLSQAKAGGIVLLHDGGGDRRATVTALPTIIRKLQAQGFKFVTIPELLQASITRVPPPPQPTPVPSPEVPMPEVLETWPSSF